MLRGIFEPFGKIDNIQLIMDPETGRSKGYGFLTVSYLFIWKTSKNESPEDIRLINLMLNIVLNW